jgi:hypothetical protein
MATRVNELTNFTFPDTGITVKIRKVSPLLMMEVQKRNKPPKPPMQEVDYGDDKITYEANPSHPDHIADLEQYNYDLEEKIRALTIKRGVVCDVPEDEIKELREFWKTEMGEELPEKNDKIAYISYICIGTQEDLEDLLSAITKRSQPTKPVIEAAKASFPDDV